ncbi:hypothetical protein ABXJ76_07335 [Methylobacter sp. G7]|uniref:hypothetical protein n=1 Tax=Methylobacter sp. G7 TaxID=3230117 RepID=UPI003D804374
MKKILYVLILLLTFPSFVNASSVAENPAIAADSIVIFVPSKDQSLLITDQELIIEGSIAKVEKGVAPSLIIIPAHSFLMPLQTGIPERMYQTGIPERMYLRKLTDRDAYSPMQQYILSFKERMTSPPIISVSIVDEFGSEIFSAGIGQYFPTSTYYFNATISFPGAFVGTPFKGDVYFGVIPPENNRSFTWVTDGGVNSLKEGLIPIARDIGISQNSTFSLSSTLGQSIQYAFKNTESAGMYSIFALLVASGADPSVTRNWIGINMVPLVIVRNDAVIL